MAHNLTIHEDGTVEMAYTGEKGWHGLGNSVPFGSTPAQFRTAARMDWEVESVPVQFVLPAPRTLRLGNDESAETVTTDTFGVKKRRVLYRSDNGMPLGIVADGFHVVGPKEVTEFFNDLILGLGMTMETCGSLHGGKRLWATAKIGEDYVGPEDHIRAYLLLTTALDGTHATKAKFVSTRTVCENTLEFGLGEDGLEVAVSHRMQFDEKKVKERLGIGQQSFEKFIDDMRKLASTPVNTAVATELTSELIGTDKSERFDRIMGLFSGQQLGADIVEGVDGTAWGWLNAITEYVDHEAKAKDLSRRIGNSLMGRGAALKAKARDMILDLAGV